MKKTSLAFLFGILFVVAIAATRAPFYASSPTQVQTGSCVASADGTVTQAFAVAYSSAPKVVATQTGLGLNSSTNIIKSITTTNFVINTGLGSTTNNWIAVGTP